MKERAKYAPTFSKLRALMANGLTDIDLVRCWVSWRILPLSRCLGLMCEYNSDLKDPQRHCEIQLSNAEVTEGTKALFNETWAECSKTGLNPYCTFNRPPAVSVAHHSSSLDHVFINTYPLMII